MPPGLPLGRVSAETQDVPLRSGTCKGTGSGPPGSNFDKSLCGRSAFFHLDIHFGSMGSIACGRRSSSMVTVAGMSRHGRMIHDSSRKTTAPSTSYFAHGHDLRSPKYSIVAISAAFPGHCLYPFEMPLSGISSNQFFHRRGVVPSGLCRDSRGDLAKSIELGKIREQLGNE